MTTAAKLEVTGAPEVIKLINVEPSSPGKNEVWLEQESIGVNFLDVMQRNGAVSIPLPSGLGLEGSGRVAAVGPDVKDVVVGDRVAYAMGPIGSYASGRIYPADRLIKLPDAISFDDAAAVLFKGLTAQYLIHTTYPVVAGTTVLLYGAAGALGQIMVPWINYLGGSVIGVVSKSDSVERAKEAGCSHVLVWSDDLPAQVGKLTSGSMVDVVYDGIGRNTFDASLACLRPRGMMVSIGASSGLPEPVSIKTLNEKSLFLTRPSIAAHILDSAEYRQRAADLFDMVSKGVVKPAVWKAFPLSEVAAAHAQLEDGKSAGAILLKP